MTEDRYLAAHAIYLKNENPIEQSNLVINNDFPNEPVLAFNKLLIPS